MSMLRRFAPVCIALAALATLVLAVGAQSAPGTGTSVPTLAEHNALEARVTALEEWVASAPTPTPTPTEEPTPTPTPDPEPTPGPDPEPGEVPVPADFPTASSVGPTAEPTVTYGGSCTVTQNNLVIDNRIVNCQSDGLEIAATGVVIRNSVVNGGVFTTFREQTPAADNNSHATVFTVESSRIVAGPATSHDGRALGWAHFVVRDSHVIGSHSGAFAYNKTVFEDNYIQTDGTSTHQSGLRMLKNSTLRGNTIFCKPANTDTDGGCSADAVFYREFGTPVNLTIERNYFRTTKPTSGHGQWFATRFIDCHTVDVCTGIKFTGNLFDLGQGTDGGEFPNDAGDVWSDNYWTDGTPALSNDSR